MYANKNESNTNTPNKKLKQSLYRSGHALSVPEGWGSQISGQSSIINSTHRLPLPPGNTAGTHFF